MADICLSRIIAFDYTKIVSIKKRNGTCFTGFCYTKFKQHFQCNWSTVNVHSNSFSIQTKTANFVYFCNLEYLAHEIKVNQF